MDIRQFYLYATGAALFIIAAAASISWLLLLPIPPKQHAVAKSDVGSIKDCKGKQFECYNDFLTLRTRSAEPTEAMKEIRQGYETDEYVKTQCHQLTHIVGREAIKKYGTIREAFLHGDSFCWSGYHHGVVEAAIKDIGADRIKEQANELCSGFAAAKQYSFDHYNCVHGMGHGFMAVEEMDVFKALKACDLLNNKWERESCYGGAYMENIMIEARGEGKSPFLRPEEPMYPCTAVEPLYKEPCYMMQTSYALQQNSYNFGATFTLCRDLIDKDFTISCYESLGRDASGSTVSNVEKTVTNCRQAPDSLGLLHCTLGAARDFVSYHHNDTKAKEFCKQFDKTIADRCTKEVKAYYATFR